MTREDAIDIIKSECYVFNPLNFDRSTMINTALDIAIKALEQEPKTGHWIVEVWNNKEHRTCSVCQILVDYEPCYHYCPYCGAKMAESEEK